MTVMIILKLIVSIVAIASLAVLMRSAYVVEEQPELPQELELAA
jgi:hypothetical protein